MLIGNMTKKEGTITSSAKTVCRCTWSCILARKARIGLVLILCFVLLIPPALPGSTDMPDGIVRRRRGRPSSRICQERKGKHLIESLRANGGLMQVLSENKNTSVHCDTKQETVQPMAGKALLKKRKATESLIGCTMLGCPAQSLCKHRCVNIVRL